MKGAKPLPRNVRQFNGTKKSRINPDEPILPVVVPDPPKFLSRRERKVFRDTVALMAGMRVMSAADVEAMTLYAVERVRWQDAVEQLADQDLVLTSKQGNPCRNPLVGIADEAMRRCLTMLAEFGMTPSSRTRVKSS